MVSLGGQIVIAVFAAVAGFKKNNIPDAVFWIARAVLLAGYATCSLG